MYPIYGIMVIPRIRMYEDVLYVVSFIFQKVEVFHFKYFHHKHLSNNM